MNDLLDQFFHDLPLPSDISTDRLDQIIKALFAVDAQVPTCQLSVKQKRSLGGYLFLEGPLIVYEVVRALRRKWPLFPDVPVDPQELSDGMARAGRWLILRELSLRIAACADAHFTLARATQVSRGLRILRHVRADAGRAFPGPLDELRRSALAIAEQMLLRHLLRGKKKEKMTP